MLTVIVDYDSGNLHSAEKAFQRMAQEADAGQVLVTSEPDDVARADRIVLPGDGAFPACRNALMQDRAGLYEAITEAAVMKGRPFLGICVGMQMMASVGREYHDTPGFGWIEGEITKIIPDTPGLKVPHMGWNDLILTSPSTDKHPVLEGIETGDHAYFVHSYQFDVRHFDERAAHVDYGGEVTAIVARGTMIGTQFHPEKSQNTGLRLISNFLKWAP
ncbi:MAG: imidazole glycerol phosphate synthase subunit HisH [Pseudomonadota bacterium]